MKKIIVNKDIEKQIIDLYLINELSMEQIKLKVNYNVNTIRNVLKDNNIKIRDLKESKYTKSYRNDGRFKKGMNAWNKGIPRTEEELKNISIKTKEGMLKNREVFLNGIKKRSSNEKWKQTVSINMINLWKDESYRNRQLIFLKSRDFIAIGKKVSDTKIKMYQEGLLKAWNKGYGLYVEGEKNPNWLGGLSKEKYSIEYNNILKNNIHERDMCCMLCNVSIDDLKSLNKRIHTHHIDYNKQNNLKENLITLCHNCHMITGFNREKWKIFFYSLLNERYGYEYNNNQQIIIDIDKITQGD